MKLKKIIINTSSQKYPILIGTNLISKLPGLLKTNSIKFNKCLFVIDKKVPKKMILKIKKSFKNKKVYFHYFKANELNKNMKSVNKILLFLFKENFSRQDCLIAVGGGITGDVSSFAASLYKRGLNFVNIPTTLLSQVDSSIGGKTGINTKQGKNLIGTFYQPKLVISDINFLKTLQKREVICGYAEILKHSLISSKIFFKFLDINLTKILKLKSPHIEKAIFQSCVIKKNVVEKDENENSYRKILNFGHTFAHAFEASLNFSKKLNHGEAVILGINSAINFSFKRKILKAKNYNLIKKHLNNSSILYKAKNYFTLNDSNNILKFMRKDKKNNSGKINLILLKDIGLPILNLKFKDKEIKNFLHKELSK